MSMRARHLGIGATAVALGISLLAAGAGSAAGEKDARAAVLKIAGLIEKGDEAGAKKAAAAAAKDLDLEDVMNQMGLRKKKGLGYGKEGNPDDGIEKKLLSIGKKPMPTAQLAKESDDLVKAAHVVAAIAEVAIAKPPEKDSGMKKKKDWMEWSKQMRDSSTELADAAKAKKPDAVLKAVKSLNSSCNNCHGVFRD